MRVVVGGSLRRQQAFSIREWIKQRWARTPPTRALQVAHDERREIREVQDGSWNRSAWSPTEQQYPVTAPSLPIACVSEVMTGAKGDAVIRPTLCFSGGWSHREIESLCPHFLPVWGLLPIRNLQAWMIATHRTLCASILHVVDTTRVLLIRQFSLSDPLNKS